MLLVGGVSAASIGGVSEGGGANVRSTSAGLAVAITADRLIAKVGGDHIIGSPSSDSEKLTADSEETLCKFVSRPEKVASISTAVALVCDIPRRLSLHRWYTKRRSLILAKIGPKITSQQFTRLL